MIIPTGWVPTTFGDMLEFPKPNDSNLVLLSVGLAQYQPLSLLLPHQIYRHNLRRILEQHPGATSLVVHPIRSDEAIEIPLYWAKEGR